MSFFHQPRKSFLLQPGEDANALQNEYIHMEPLMLVDVLALSRCDAEFRSLSSFCCSGGDRTTPALNIAFNSCVGVESVHLNLSDRTALD